MSYIHIKYETARMKTQIKLQPETALQPEVVS